jgi:hypothetical protein
MSTQPDSWSAERSALAADSLRRGGRLRLQVRGESMLPSLWPGDAIEIADCQLGDIQPGEIVLALRDGRLFLHRFRAHRGQYGFLLRGDSMASPDPVFPSNAFLGRLVGIASAGRTIPVPVRLRPWCRALGWLACYSGIVRRLALRLHQWRISQAPQFRDSLATARQGTR